MSVETALEQMLGLIHQRALNLAALPEDERDWHYDLIRLSCCGAAEQIGQSPAEAAVTANNMVEFTRAMVGIIDAGSEQAQASERDTRRWSAARSQ
jgi:hypothetical protein